MREIKFEIMVRNKKYQEVSYIEVVTLQQLIERNGCLLNANDELVYARQFTGLKDKNGKEIFESDILKVYDWGSKTSNDLIGIAVVEWDVDTKGWVHNPEFDIDEYDMFRNVEVIGNIFENKELLKQEVK